jgi:hypothetical protein
MEMEEEQFVGYEHAVSLASDQAAVTALSSILKGRLRLLKLNRRGRML